MCCLKKRRIYWEIKKPKEVNQIENIQQDPSIHTFPHTELHIQQDNEPFDY